MLCQQNNCRVSRKEKKNWFYQLLRVIKLQIWMIKYVTILCDKNFYFSCFGFDENVQWCVRKRCRILTRLLGFFVDRPTMLSLLEHLLRMSLILRVKPVFLCNFQVCWMIHQCSSREFCSERGILVRLSSYAKDSQRNPPECVRRRRPSPG